MNKAVVECPCSYEVDAILKNEHGRELYIWRGFDGT